MRTGKPDSPLYFFADFDEEYGESPVDDMLTDYDYHINTGELPELFDDEVIDDFVANLDDWD